MATDRAERDFRWARIRAGMHRQDIDLLVILPESSAADAFYAADEFGVVLFPGDGDPEILLAGEDSHLAVARDGWISQRSSATPFGSTKVPYGRVVSDHLRRRYRGIRRLAVAGLAGNDYTHVRSADGYVIYATVEAIRQALPGVAVVDGSPVLAAARRVRSPADIRRFTAGIAVAEAGARAIADRFVPGTSQADAFTAGLVEMLRPGLGIPTIAWCPGRWGNPRPRLVSTPAGTIDSDLVVAAEVMPGYREVVQIAQPFLGGPATAMQRDMFDLNIAAFNAACAALRPGATWREVRDTVTAVAKGTPFGMCFLLHSGADGPLFIPNDAPPAVLDDPVEAGSVFICKPTAYPLSAGRVTARSFDVSWGDMITVEDGGARRLGSRPQSLSQHDAGPARIAAE